MMSKDIALVIPARYASSRLPGKPLVELLGKSMVERTWRQCIKAVPAAQTYVATDDERIRQHCVERGIQSVITPSTCLTGTDRIAAAAKLIPAKTYINVQGDEPVIDPADIASIVAAAAKHPDEILCGYCEITDEQSFRSPTIPKVITRPDGRLLYMSRGAIPTSKSLGFVRAWRQVCVYAFPADALRAFAAHGRKTAIEEIEDIEILRFLELGYDVRMVEVSSASIAVDTPEDVARAEAAIRERAL